MKITKNLKILTSFWFIFCLVILLINDFYLKDIFGNWFTGKLSDFAGLFIFTLFFIALFPKWKNLIFYLTAFFFIFWKSQYSQPLINTWNSLKIINISRVIDYTDLIALIILPLAYYLGEKKSLKKIKINPIIPLLISAFAFIATSKTKIKCFDDKNSTYFIKHFSRDSLIQDLKQSHLNITFSKYHNTSYDNEHAEIYHLNDTLENLVLLIKDYNSKNKTVEVKLGCWGLNQEDNKSFIFKSLKNEKDYVKNSFERLIITNLEKIN